MEGSTKDTLFMLAVKRVPFGPWHRRGLKCFGQLSSPSPTVKKRLSSISVGTATFPRLLKLPVKAVAVAVSLNAGREGKMGLVVTHFEGQGMFSYSRIAVVVVLSKGAPWALW